MLSTGDIDWGNVLSFIFAISQIYSLPKEEHKIIMSDAKKP